MKFFAILLALGFQAVCCKQHSDSSFLNHVELVNEFRCRIPQPRAVPIDELLIVGPSPDELFFPSSTVLARCQGAGCCPGRDHICAPVQTRNVSLVFTVQHVIDRQRDRHHEVIHAVEHVKCACINRSKVEMD